MSLSITHTFVSSKSDGNDDTLVRPSNWNAVHTLTGFPDDATLYLDGTGSFSTPSGGAGGGGDLLSSDNTWTGTNLFSSQLFVGGTPDCDQSQLTVYFTMTPETNSSMVDIVAQSDGAENAAAIVALISGNGTIGDYINTIYCRADVDSGSTGNATVIWIDSSEVSGTLGTAFGLYIADFSLSGAGSSANIFSVGRNSQNYFEGVLTQSPFNQQQSGTISDGGSSSSGNQINGLTTEFTADVFVGDIVTNGSGVGQVINIAADNQMYVWPPGSFDGVSGSIWNVYPATLRLVDQLTNQGMSFAFNQSAWVISGFSGLDASPCNFVIGSPTNMVNGETQFSAVLGGNNNTVSSSQSVIIGGINNVITGNQSVVLAGDAMTVSGNEVVAMSLSSNAWTVAQSNCFIIMDGNVGIGTVAPAFALEVVGDVHVSAAILHIDDSQWIDFRDTDTNWRLGYMPSGDDGGAFTMTNISTAMQQVIGSGDTDGWAVGQTGGNSILELKGSDQSAWFLGNINVAGNVNVNGILDIGSGFIEVYSTLLSQPAAPTLSVVGTAGSTTYTYVIQQVSGSLFSQPSSSATITGPDSLNPENYVQITLPDDVNTYIAYRTASSNSEIPIGSLLTWTSTLTDQIVDPPEIGLLPFPTDRSKGFIVNSVSGERSIYVPSGGSGLILGASNGSFDSELRIVGNGGAWTDEQNVTYFQIQNQYNNMAVFMGGSYGTDAPLDRLQFCSAHSTFTNAAFTSTPVPTSILEVVNTVVGTRGLFVSAPNGQTANIVEVDLDGEWVFYVDQNGTTNTENLSATGSITATTLTGGYQNWDSGDPTLNFDLSKGNVQTLTLTTNTSPTFTNVTGGQSLTLVFTQDGTGGRTVTWPDTVNNNGNLEVNLAPNAVTTFNFISTDGTTLTPVTQSGAIALPGNPKRTQATGTYAAGDQNITITAAAYGSSGNSYTIQFDTDIQYVVTELYYVSGGLFKIGLANTGSGSTATGNDVVTAINTGIGRSQIEATVPSPGTGFVGTGSVTLSGGQDQTFTPVGGELWFDAGNLYIGQSNGSFATIAYTS